MNVLKKKIALKANMYNLVKKNKKDMMKIQDGGNWQIPRTY